jgi:leucyl aminopeptidase
MIDPATRVRPQPTSALRLAFVFAYLVWTMMPAAAGATSPAGESPVGTAEEAAWITLGADAWEALRDGSRFRYGGQPLVEIERQADVVLTRVRAQDLGGLSGFLHGALNRCSGFMRHTSLADGLEALERRADPVSRAPQVYTVDQAATVARLGAVLEKAQIRETIERLSTDYNNRYHEHPSGVAAAQWIRDRWQGYAVDRTDVAVELVSHPGINQPSVVLTIAGATIPEEVVILGGHLDSISSNGGPRSDPSFIAPGADDNASGIAVLTEVVRAAMQVGFRPRRTVAFMGYAAEEIGLVGSQDIAARYAAAGVDVVAVLQLDMTDYNGSVEDIGLLSDNTDSTLTAFVADLVDTYQPELAWASTACGYPCSDHASWHGEGYPAAMSFEARVGEHNPFIHSVSDTLATLGDTVDHAFKFARLAVAFMAEIAKTGALNIFADGFESGDTSRWARVTSGPAAGSLVQSDNPSGGGYAARLPVSRPCADGDYAVPDGPLSTDPAVAPCGELTANDVDVVSGSVRFRAGRAIDLGEGFSVGSAASFAAEAGETVLGATYVRDESPAAVEEYYARFFIDPDSLALSDGAQRFDHLVAYDGGDQPEFLVGVTYNSGLAERRLFVTAFETDGTARTTRGACELALASGWQAVDVHWRASGAAAGDVEISINGGTAQSLAACLSLTGGLDNGDGDISAVEWGAKSIAGESLGSLDMDDFDSSGSF